MSWTADLSLVAYARVIEAGLLWRGSDIARGDDVDSKRHRYRWGGGYACKK